MAFSASASIYPIIYLARSFLWTFKKKYQVMAIAKYGRAPIRKLTSFDATHCIPGYLFVL